MRERKVSENTTTHVGKLYLHRWCCPLKGVQFSLRQVKKPDHNLVGSLWCRRDGGRYKSVFGKTGNKVIVDGEHGVGRESACARDNKVDCIIPRGSQVFQNMVVTGKVQVNMVHLQQGQQLLDKCLGVAMIPGTENGNMSNHDFNTGRLCQDLSQPFVLLLQLLRTPGILAITIRRIHGIQLGGDVARHHKGVKKDDPEHRIFPKFPDVFIIPCRPVQRKVTQRYKQEAGAAAEGWWRWLRAFLHVPAWIPCGVLDECLHLASCIMVSHHNPPIERYRGEDIKDREDREDKEKTSESHGLNGCSRFSGNCHSYHGIWRDGWV